MLSLGTPVTCGVPNDATPWVWHTKTRPGGLQSCTTKGARCKSPWFREATFLGGCLRHAEAARSFFFTQHTQCTTAPCADAWHHLVAPPPSVIGRLQIVGRVWSSSIQFSSRLQKHNETGSFSAQDLADKEGVGRSEHLKNELPQHRSPYAGLSDTPKTCVIFRTCAAGFQAYHILARTTREHLGTRPHPERHQPPKKYPTFSQGIRIGSACKVMQRLTVAHLFPRRPAHQGNPCRSCRPLESEPQMSRRSRASLLMRSCCRSSGGHTTNVDSDTRCSSRSLTHASHRHEGGKISAGPSHPQCLRLACRNVQVKRRGGILLRESSCLRPLAALQPLLELGR